jgi:hypothetical protein
MKCVTRTGKKKDASQPLVRKAEGKRQLEKLSVDGRMVGLLK